jgi:hypothetical protein
MQNYDWIENVIGKDQLKDVATGVRLILKWFIEK